MERARRKEQADRAYELQVKSGSLGAIKATVYGLTLVTLAHYTWPLFRRQTLAVKGFLVSSCLSIPHPTSPRTLNAVFLGTIFGLVVGADTALLSHEAEHRRVEDRLRREARIELAQQGKVATEPEIVRWIVRKEELAREKEQTKKPST